MTDHKPIQVENSALIEAFIVQPCPPHAWGHAPTVGYFHCQKCNQRIEYNDPRYTQMLAEWDALTKAPMEHVI